MAETFRAVPEQANGNYERRLGELFAAKKTEYVRYADTLIYRNVPYQELNTDILELAKDLVQEVFTDLLKNKNIDFAMADNQIQSYVARRIKGKFLEWLKKYSRNGSDNPKKIPEKNYVSTESVIETPDSSSGANPEALMQERQLPRAVNNVLKTLSPRENKVIKMRHGFPPYNKEHSLEEVGEEMGGVTRERVRQIEAKAIKRLRHPKRARKLRESY
ncbi:MAG: sigma-70 family RNA polymerase sigma factor [Patescibacteria group bacterium]|nr:sigma-70 family RNA polymerase sigma factor [Patescibacteria group bacterium]